MSPNQARLPSESPVSSRVKIHLIESLNTPDNLLDQKLQQGEKYCRVQLFTLSHGLNYHQIDIALIGKVIENDLLVYFPNGKFRLSDLIAI